jgi:DNA-binding response OmpR family regulator
MVRNTSGLGSVLIVEDDVLQSDRLAEALTDAGADEVRCCATATQALAEFKTFSPAILILDVRLADRDDGWLMVELAQQLFARMPLVVFATGSPERIPPWIAKLGILAVKPYDLGELIERIRSRAPAPRQSRWRALLRRRRAASG